MSSRPSYDSAGQKVGMTRHEEGEPKRRLTRRGLQRRQELLQAALLQFSEYGYEGATTRAIAERSGVTEAVVFRYFPTKLDLFRAVVGESTPSIHYSMPYEEWDGHPFEAAIEGLVKGYLDHAWASRRQLRLFLIATFHDDEILDSLRKLYDFRRDRLHEMIVSRMDAGEVRSEAAEFAAEMISLSMTGFLVRTLRQEPDNWPMARDGFVRQLLGMIDGGISASR